MEKYGFVYIWFDRKHKRYYIGCHWGSLNDGYICSSSNMKSAYKRRPNDFKRKILKTNIDDKKLLLEEEYYWLSKIKTGELGKKYYNLHNHHFNHWTTNNESKLTVGEKISLSHKQHPNWGQWSKGKVLSEETKQKIREANKRQFEDEEQREMRRKKSKELWSDTNYRKLNTENKIGKKQSSEQIQKRIESSKKRWEISPKLGKSKTEEEKRKLSETFKNMIWINNGNVNKRINIYEEIPNGFVKGRVKG